MCSHLVLFISIFSFTLDHQSYFILLMSWIDLFTFWISLDLAEADSRKRRGKSGHQGSVIRGYDFILMETMMVTLPKQRMVLFEKVLLQPDGNGLLSSFFFVKRKRICSYIYMLHSLMNNCIRMSVLLIRAIHFVRSTVLSFVTMIWPLWLSWGTLQPVAWNISECNSESASELYRLIYIYSRNNASQSKSFERASRPSSNFDQMTLVISAEISSCIHLVRAHHYAVIIKTANAVRCDNSPRIC